MSSTTRYLVRFKPLDAYFFSGRETFDYSSGKILDVETPNYYVKSEYFPQQTTILGVLRRELLIIKDLYEEKRYNYENKKLDEIINLIGSGSFNASMPEGYKNEDSFGVIKNISPVFLYKNKNVFTPAPLNYELMFEKLEGNCYFNSNKKNKNYKSFIPNLKNFKMKEGLNEKIVSLNPYEKIYSYDDVFLADERIGINVKADEDGFYRQRCYKLKNDFEFCCYMELANNVLGISGDEIYSSTVYIGAEGRAFKLTLELDYTNHSIDKFQTENNRIVCIGDVLLKQDEFNEIKEESEFILGKTRYFKNYVSDYKGNSKDAQPWLLLKRGSVIFVESEVKRKEIEKIIDQKHIKVIGYNHITGGVK